MAQHPTIYNKTLTSADTEYSQTIPARCKKIEIQNRSASIIRLAFETGKVATPTAPYFTIKANSSWFINDINTELTLYLGSPDAATVAEVLVWNV